MLHDLNEAGRYADRIVAMRDGLIAADGPPATILTQQTIGSAFGLHCRILHDPDTGAPLVIPSRARGTVRRPAPPGSAIAGVPGDEAGHAI